MLVYDADVEKEWEKRLVKRRTGRRIHGYLCRALVLTLLFIALFKPPIYLLVLVFVSLVTCILAEGVFSNHLRCPNCGKVPTVRLGVHLRSPDDPAEAEYCPHCMCNLIPRA